MTHHAKKAHNACTTAAADHCMYLPGLVHHLKSTPICKYAVQCSTFVVHTRQAAADMDRRTVGTNRNCM